MFKFIVTSIEINNSKHKVHKLRALKYSSNELINKALIAKENLNFREGNKYSCKIEKEDDYNIYIKDIEQIDLDVNVIKECINYLSKYENVDFLINLLLNDSLEIINNELKKYNFIEENEIIERLSYIYNKNKLIIFLDKYNIDIKSNEVKGVIEYILNKYSNKDIDKIFKEKPFLIEYFFRLDLKIMKKINNKQCNLYQIILALDEIERQGHTFAFINQLEKVIEEKSYLDIRNLNDDLIFLEEEEVLKIIDDKIYFIENYIAEFNVINKIKERFNIKPNINNKLQTIIEEEINKLHYKLDKEQELAIYKALENNLTIITGGAGTGKTTIIDILIKCINRLDSNKKVGVVALAGKAVNVINSKLTSSYSKAQTIHKMLNIKDNIRFHKDLSIKRLDYLIIDEVSMLDIKLLNVILSSLDVKTKIILVGDINQAEPIGIGSPISDIIKSGKVCVIRLKSNNRSKCNIIAKNSQRILDDNNILEYNNNEFESIECKNTEKSLLRKFDELINEGISIDDILILAFKTQKVNKINQKIALLDGELIRTERKIIVGDKVIQSKNNNKKRVYNGEQGVVTKIYEDLDVLEVYVNFGDKLIKYDEKTLNELELSYAISIHKAQGSQSKVVIVVIDKNDEEFLNKNLLYTAITRAEERCIIIQENNIFNECICKRPKNKNSMIYDELVKLT